MQKFFTNQKALIGVVIGLTTLGTSEALATSAFNSRTGDRVTTSNILAGSEVSGSGNGLANNTQTWPASPESLVAFISNGDTSYRHRFVKSSSESLGIQFPRIYGLSEKAYGQLPLGGIGLDSAYGFDVAGYDGKALGRADSVLNVTPFQPVFVSPEIHAEKAGVDAKVDVSPVPLPAAVWSFLVGLLGILGLKKRKQASTDTAS